jgi:hypothetical protein
MSTLIDVAVFVVAVVGLIALVLYVRTKHA